MSARIRKSKQTTRTEEDQVAAIPKSGDTDTLADIDSLLDEIDEVLEENAQEFVAQYIQKGGQ